MALCAGHAQYSDISTDSRSHKKDQSPTLTGLAVVGETLTATAGTFSGGEGTLKVTTTIKKSDTGSGGWSNATSNLTYELQAGDDSKFFRATCKATDDAGQSMNSDYSAVVGPVVTPTEIKSVTITADGVLIEYGQPIHCRIDTPVAMEAAITGDANPSYKWEARSNYPMTVEQQAAITTLTFAQEGTATVTLTVTDSTATDSPITYAMNFYVASQAEWDALHPDA